jgi:hypothetical protein
LSQRTRDRTTGAAARSQPEPQTKAPDATDAADARPTSSRGRTTTRAATPPSPTRQPRARRSAAAGAAGEPPPAHPLDPDAIARTLRAVADALERDPALARQVAHAAAPPLASADHADASPPPGASRARARPFQPRLVVGTAPALGPGVPDPFALRAQLGADGLQTALADLRLGTLRAIVREHRLDPAGRVMRQNDAERLRALILEATAAAAPR